MRVMIVGRFLICAISVLGIGLSSGDCFGGVSLGVYPPIVDLSIPPGKDHAIDLTVYNQGDRVMSVTAYVSALEVSVDGDPIPLDTRKGKWSCADWITLDKQTFDLAPGEDQSVCATLRVPRGTSGGRYAAILFEGSPASGAQGAINVALGARVGTIVMESVPHTLTRQGEVESVEASRTGPDSVRFAVRFRNIGNIHLKTRGSVVIRNDSGRVVDRVPLDVGTGTVLPDGVRKFTGAWHNPRRMVKGDYTGEVRVDSEGMRRASEVVAFSVK
jgi:hypothetical protein